MHTGRSAAVAALVVAAAALLASSIFGILNFTPGVSPQLGGFLQLAFFGSVLGVLGAAGAYAFVCSRDAGSYRRFERALDQRKAALSAVPVGLVAVLVGGCWYLVKNSTSAPALPGGAAFASVDTIGIAAFLGFGSLYVIGASFLAIKTERAAIRSARADLEAQP